MIPELTNPTPMSEQAIEDTLNELDFQRIEDELNEQLPDGWYCKVSEA